MGWSGMVFMLTGTVCYNNNNNIQISIQPVIGCNFRGGGGGGSVPMVRIRWLSIRSPHEECEQCVKRD